MGKMLCSLFPCQEGRENRRAASPESSHHAAPDHSYQLPASWTSDSGSRVNARLLRQLTLGGSVSHSPKPLPGILLRGHLYASQALRSQSSRKSCSAVMPNRIICLPHLSLKFWFCQWLLQFGPMRIEMWNILPSDT